MRPLTPIYEINPLQDPRWNLLLKHSPRSSVFHTVEWLDALCRTYGYEPIALTTCSPSSDLHNAIVFCSVDSWLTGRRLVSLPFSDHCDPLVGSREELAFIVSGLKRERQGRKLRYIEIRPRQVLDRTAFPPHSTQSYCLHQIDLAPDIERLFSNCHKSSTQRKVLRAEREGLTYEEGRSTILLDTFYRLTTLTRRRHQLPPQPRKWFQNLIDCFGEALKIRVAFKDKRAVAAILTLRHKDSLIYKYGCSDASFHNLGGMHFLFWRSIQEAKRDGLSVFDLGRSDWEDTGLLTFKDRWGAERSDLTYLRFGAAAPADDGWKQRAARKVFAVLPEAMLRLAGKMIYRHLG